MRPAEIDRRGEIQMQKNPYQAYKQQSVMTMTQGEMLNKLYEEAAKQLSFA